MRLTSIPDREPFCARRFAPCNAVGPGVIITCFIVVLWAGSWVFAVIERALNRIWRATSRTFWHGRAITVGMIGIVGLLLALSVLITSVVVALQRNSRQPLSPGRWLNYPLLMSVGSVFWQGIFAALSFLVTVVLFVVVYRFMPKAEVSLRDTLPGAFFGGLVVGVGEIRICLEPQLFSLRSDLRLGGRCGCGFNLELCLQPDPFVRGPTYRGIPSRASSLPAPATSCYLLPLRSKR